MSSKRKRAAEADSETQNVEDLQNQIKRLTDENRRLKQENAQLMNQGGEGHEQVLANAVMYQSIRDGNLNRNTSGVQALVVTYPHEINAQRAFHYAVECNQVQIVRFLLHVFGSANELNPTLKGRVNINELGPPASRSDTNTIEETDKETPLQTAVRRGNVECVRALLEFNARDNVRTPRRRFTLLHIAVIENHAHVVRELLQLPTLNINARDTDDWAALHWAAEMGHDDCVRMLASQEKCQVNITDSSHRTPIHFAAVEGGRKQRRCIVILWKHGADINMQARSGATPIEIAKECKQFACVELLKRLGKFQGKREEVDTDDEVQSGDEDESNGEDDDGPRPPARGRDSDGTDTDGDSDSTDGEEDAAEQSKTRAASAHHGKGNGHGNKHDSFRDQVVDGMELALQDDAAAPPLHERERSMLSSPKKTKMTELEARQHQEILCEQLFAAAKCNRYSEVMALLQPSQRGEVTIECSAISSIHGSSPVHAAATRGALNALRMMVHCSHVDLDQTDVKGRTPLHVAARHGHLSTVLFLLNKKSKINTRTKKIQHSPLHAAAMCSSTAAPSICKLLVRHGLRPTVVDDRGYTPLRYAALKGNYDVMCGLLMDGATVNDDIMQAAHAGGQKTCIHLLERFMRGQGVMRHRKKDTGWQIADVTGGLEGRPVRAINEIDDATLPLEFGYLATCVEGPDVIVHYDACKGCNCTSAEMCNNPAVCACAKANQNATNVIYECNYSCSCNGSCKNRAIQRGRRFELEIFRTVGKGWGVRAVTPIPPDQFVCEYVGELIDEKEEKRRYPSLWMPLVEAAAAHAKCSPHATGAAYMGGSYVFDISATKRIDATVFGNVGRFLNHSCDPNVAPRRFFVHHRHQIFPRIAFFSTRHIPAGTELNYDYGSPTQISVDGGAGDWMACNCGARNCRGRFT
eukprot:TRINITY_DN8276_c0_g1_i1.p1 TRINITY_DN8276_c0_g1~~TRINITY_DN8276_c0_g1_i1.p1  ORF type:complete len:922 (-),score=152.88 TRINITY_DN8276_c0_g1_i1:1619-4384(-)